MVFAYCVKGLDVNAFIPLIETLVDTGDLPKDATAIAFPAGQPDAKTIYVACTQSILKDTEDITTLPVEVFAEVCQAVQSGIYQTWGAEKLFGSTPDGGAATS